MIPVSNAFMTAANSKVRKTSMRITLNFGDDADIEYAATSPDSQQAANTLVTTSNLQAGTDFYTEDWTTFGGQGAAQEWSFGESAFAPYDDESVQYGYWTRSIGDANGVFPAFVTGDGLLVSFTHEIGIPSIHITFDALSGQYAADFDIHYIGASPTAVEQIIHVTGNQLVEYSYEAEITQIYQLWIVPLKWSNPYEPFRVQGIRFFDPQVIYADGDLYEVKIVESAEQDGQLISAGANRMNVKFNNTTGKLPISYCIRGLEVLAELAFTLDDGTQEWIPMGTFFADIWDFNRTSKQVTLDAVDWLTQLSKISTAEEGVASGSLYTVGSSLLAQGGAQNGGFIISVDIDQWNVIGQSIPVNDIRSLLLELAVNAGSYLHVDRFGNILIDPHSANAPVYTIDLYNTMQNGTKARPYQTYRTVFLQTPIGEAGFNDDYRSGDDIDYTMQYIDNQPTLDLVLGIMTGTFQRRRIRYEISTRGNPANELGDTIALTSDDGSPTQGILVQAEYSYNGALKTKYLIKGEW